VLSPSESSSFGQLDPHVEGTVMFEFVQLDLHALYPCSVWISALTVVLYRCLLWSRHCLWWGRKCIIKCNL